LPEPVLVVLEGVGRAGADEGIVDGVAVVHAPRSGDDTIVALAANATGPVLLVSADRALRNRVASHGANAVGPTWLLDRLDP
jgi:rRNA-processing protein FCF1